MILIEHDCSVHRLFVARYSYFYTIKVKYHRDIICRDRQQINDNGFVIDNNSFNKIITNTKKSYYPLVVSSYYNAPFFHVVPVVFIIQLGK